MTAILVFAVILIILFVVMFSYAEIVAEYEEKNLKCAVYLYKIRIYKLKGDGNFLKLVLSQPEKFSNLINTSLRLIGKYAYVEKLDLNITVGTSNAATTAVTVGSLWASVYSLLGVIAGIVPVEKHNVNISPDYVNTVFSLSGKCIIKCRMVHIIIIIRAIFMIINPKKGKEE